MIISSIAPLAVVATRATAPFPAPPTITSSSLMAYPVPLLIISISPITAIHVPLEEPAGKVIALTTSSELSLPINSASTYVSIVATVSSAWKSE